MRRSETLTSLSDDVDKTDRNNGTLVSFTLVRIFELGTTPTCTERTI